MKQNKTKHVKKIFALVFVLVIATMFLASCADTGNIERSESDDLTEALDEMNATGERYFIVAFPGLGTEPIVIDRTLGNLGNLPLTLSGVITVCAVIAALIYAYFTVSKSGASLSDFSNLAFFGIVGGIIGGRIYYLLASFYLYKDKPFINIFNFLDGGMAIYGAIIGGALAMFIVCKIKKMSTMKIYDAVIPALLFGQVIGRLADFFGGTSYGLPIEEGSILYSLRMAIYPNIIDGTGFEYVHPIFLYESAWNLIGLALISIAFFRKKNFDGQIFFMYLAWYGFGRTFIEILRADSLYIGSVRISLLLGCLSFFAGVALLIYGVIEGKKRKLAGEEYESAYPLFKTKFSSSDAKNESNNKTEDNKK